MRTLGYLRSFSCFARISQKLIIFCLPSLILQMDIKADDESLSADKNQPSKKQSDIIVITANRVSEPVSITGSSISVVTEEEIDARKEPNLLESLRNTESLQVIQSGGPGRSTGVFLRGASPNQTLVLVDGVPVNEGNSGLFDFADIATLEVGSIEVLRGPQSSIYGADAMGGVINIISKPIDKELSTGGLMEAGSYGTHRYQARASGGSDYIRGSGGISYLDSDNISVSNRRNGNTERDPYDNLTVSGGVEGETPSCVEFKGNVRYTRARTSLDTFEFDRGLVDALNFTQKRNSIQSNFNLSKGYNFWKGELITGYNFDDFEGVDLDSEFNNYDFRSQTLNIQQLNHLHYTDELAGLLGYSYRRVDGKNVGNFNETREINSIFYQQTYKPFDETNFGIGARHDHDSTFGGKTTYRLTAAQDLAIINSNLRGSFGTGFRAPTFNDLFFPNFSNRDLNPETSRGGDIGLRSTLLNVHSDIAFFMTDYKNLIGFNTETFLPENINRGRTKGFEAKLSYSGYELIEPMLTYTYLDARNRDTNSLLPRRARHQGGMGIGIFPIEKLKFNIFAHYLVDRVDSNGVSMDDYIVFSGTIRYELYEGIEPYVRAQNAFNQRYEEVPGYGTLGASVFGGITLRM
ncbi:MAG TPA: TonB-dependent receptor [Oligoflexia bacterium]|nr:TonB-dependent receptor [Oligoflexia bacterium]